MNNRTPRPVEVLHVDDESTIHKLTSEYLARELEEVTVTTAISGKEAVTIITTTLPDCVISDYDMPGMNGLELLTTIRTRAPNLPVFMFTNMRSNEIVTAAKSAGVTAFVQKGGPEQYWKLANHIRTALAADQSDVLRSSTVTTSD